jgi:hypothetical protein
MARIAAKKRARANGKLIVHPVAIKYHLLGNVEAFVD